MNEFRNSLIVIGLTLRTFPIAVSDCFTPAAVVHSAVATRSPLNGIGPAVTLTGKLTLAPGATDSDSWATRPKVLHPLGGAIRNATPVTGAPVVFVNVIVMSCDDPGANVCNAGMLTRATSYFAATTLACTFWFVSA